MKNKKAVAIGVAVLAVLLAVFAAVRYFVWPDIIGGKTPDNSEKPAVSDTVKESDDPAESSPAVESESTGKTITVEVIHKDSSTKTFTYTTQEEFLAEVLVGEGLVEDNQGDFGLYILVVDGERADYEQDGAYWSLMKNGEATITGASETPVSDGDSFSLVYTSANGGDVTGSKTITVEVVHKDESTKTFTYHTDEEFLAEVLVGEGLVEDNQGDFGLYILVVDGERADYEQDGAYWSLLKNGEATITGASETPVSDGDSFSLVYTVA